MNARQNVLSLVKKHIELTAEKQHLEESSKDPSRLTQRGAQAAGRLLQEEKVRKKLNKELPKVFSSIQPTNAPDWARIDDCLASLGGGEWRGLFRLW